MARYLTLFAALFLTHLVVGSAASYYVFHHVDIRQTAVVAVLVVPAVQAVAVHLVTVKELPWGALRLGATPLLGALLGVDALLLTLGLFVRPAFVGAKVAAAALAFLAVAVRRRSPLAALLGLGLAGWGADYFVPWLHRIPPFFMGSKPIVFQWLVVNGALFVTALVVVLAVARRSSPAAGVALEAVTAAAFLAALVAIPGYFERGALIEPRRSLVMGLGSLVGTFVLSAALTELRRERDA